MAVSPTCQVKDGGGAYVATTSGVSVTPGNTITIKLTDTSAQSWSISCISTDELSVAATVTSSLTIDTTAKTATFTAPAAGRVYRFRSTVNGGVGPDGTAQSSYSTTFCIYTTLYGDRLLAANETTEADATFGWLSRINNFRRQSPTPMSLATNFTCTTSASGGATNLSLAVGSADVWLIEFGGVIECSSTGGVKLAVVGPASSTAEGSIFGEAGALTTYSSVRITDTSSYFGAFATVATTSEGVQGFARVKMAGTAGTVVLSARPVTNTQTATLRAGFWMRARQVTEV